LQRHHEAHDSRCRHERLYFALDAGPLRPDNPGATFQLEFSTLAPRRIKRAEPARTFLIATRCYYEPWIGSDGLRRGVAQS